MKFTSFTSVLFSVSLFALPSTALPASKRDVFVPPVLYPHAGTVWQAKSRHNVTWDVSNPPVNITNKRGRIYLRRRGLNTGLVLADDFDILLGRIEVTVPWMVDGSDYQIILFGDSGNFSPEFTIHSGIPF